MNGDPQKSLDSSELEPEFQASDPLATKQAKLPTYSGITTLSFCVVGADGNLRSPLDEDYMTLAEDTKIQGRYQLQSELGRGGMGCVYLARDSRLDRFVAIKVVAGSRSIRRPLDTALAREARLGAGLNHPAIAAVYDFGFHHERPFTVFEYVAGDGLRQILERRNRLPLVEVLAIIGTLARALDFAHSHGIVHRDLKPENVRASKQGKFKILDLGLAQEYRRRQNWTAFAGTPAYASPEQSSGLPTDGRTDQYALAVIAYEMLVGQRPFQADKPSDLLRMHQSHPPTPPNSYLSDLPELVSASLMRALEKDPHHRFANCEEFALALGAIGHLTETPRLVVDNGEDGRTNIYICHSGDNSPMARQLAQALQREGISCWYYEHDALPGISYMTQTTAAIKQADAVVLMVSAESINSPELRREVQEAYHLGRPFLPVLLGLSRQEFQQRQPDWQPILGASATIDLTAGNLSSAVARVAKSLELWGISKRPRASMPSQSASIGGSHHPIAGRVLSDGSHKIWASDANQIEIQDLDSVVFHNPLVDDFLDGRNKFFLSASKGLGKTLLLTFKRSLLTRTYRQPGSDVPQTVVTFVPQGRPFLDFMSDVRSLSKQHEHLVTDLINTKRMWSLALNISALSHHAPLVTVDDQEEVAFFPRRMQQWLRGATIQPTVVFKELLGQSVRDINRLIDTSENFLDYKLRQVHSGTFFFIDKVDQALRQLSQPAWVCVQAGLIEAAWDMMNANSHIKVYASIRQEAFSNYESDIKANLFGATTLLRYSEEELQQMLDQLAHCYEGCESFKDFATLNVVKHDRRPFPEDSFRYVRRHTLGRPRDLVIIASELSAKRKSMNQSQFCKLVNETSAAGLVSNIFDESRVFLKCLLDKRERQRFFGLIPHNVLSSEEAIRICCLFNGLSENEFEIYQASFEALNHPFCDLYRVGLLGTIIRDPGSGRALQKFKQPHDFIADIEDVLPKSRYYLIHPALDEHIGQLRTGNEYSLFQHVTVGDGQAWEDYFDVFCSLEKCLFEIDDNTLRAAAYRLLNEARIVLTSDRETHLSTVLQGSPEVQFLRQRCNDLGLDDLSYWIEELIEFGNK